MLTVHQKNETPANLDFGEGAYLSCGHKEQHYEHLIWLDGSIRYYTCDQCWNGIVGAVVREIADDALRATLKRIAKL